MVDLKITWETILMIMGGIAIIYSGISALSNLLNPFRKVESELQKGERKLANDDARIKCLESKMCESEESNRIICKSLLVLLNHEITGNCIDNLKAQRDELQQFLIDR